MARLTKLLKPYLWFTSMSTWIGYFAIALGIYLLTQQYVDLSWIIVSLVSYLGLQMGLTVGMHRLSTHSAFECNRFWETILVYFATIGVYGTTIQWSAMHMEHHRHHDTDLDPHNTLWRYFLWQNNRNDRIDSVTVRRLARSPIHSFFHRYYLIVIFSTVLVLAIINPILLLFGYLIPLGFYHFVMSCHMVLAHRGGQPLDQPYLEFLLPLGGEWQHKNHHKNWRELKFGRFDLGFILIKLIQK